MSVTCKSVEAPPELSVFQKSFSTGLERVFVQCIQSFAQNFLNEKESADLLQLISLPLIGRALFKYIENLLPHFE